MGKKVSVSSKLADFVFNHEPDQKITHPVRSALPSPAQLKSLGRDSSAADGTEPHGVAVSGIDRQTIQRGGGTSGRLKT